MSGRKSQQLARTLQQLHTTQPDAARRIRHHITSLKSEASNYRLQLRTAQTELKDAQTLIAALLRQLGDSSRGTADPSLRAGSAASETAAAGSCGLSADCGSDRSCSCRSDGVDRRTTNPMPHEEQL